MSRIEAGKLAWRPKVAGVKVLVLERLVPPVVMVCIYSCNRGPWPLLFYRLKLPRR